MKQKLQRFPIYLDSIDEFSAKGREEVTKLAEYAAHQSYRGLLGRSSHVSALIEGVEYGFVVSELLGHLNRDELKCQ